MKKLKLETAEGRSSAVVTKSDDNESHSFKKKKKKKKSNSKFKIQDAEISTTTDDIKEEVKTLVPPSPIKIEKPDTDGSARERLSTLWLNYKPRSMPLIKAGSDWYEQLIEESPENSIIDSKTKKELKQIASQIHQHDVDRYKKLEERKNKGDVHFRNTVFNVGTMRDKVAAHVLRCMESPAHSLYHLNLVITMISSKAKSELPQAIDSVTDLLISTLLPNKRVARRFENHQFSRLLPLLDSNREQAEKQLALWYFEDQLSSAYRLLVSQLVQVSGESVDQTKKYAIRKLANLVKNHPDQDTEVILEAVINKMGDPSRKVASHSMLALKSILDNFAHLKERVVAIVEMLLYRPNVPAKAQYYCLCYLKDIIFKRAETQLAAKLIRLYIGFFKACIKKGEVDTRMMGALLRGINRAFPYSQLHGDSLQEQLDTLYKLCHVVNFTVATQALQLIYHVITRKSHVEDRFYQVLYRQVQDRSFGSSSGSSAFLNLVFKALMRDDSIERRQAFIKRLLQVVQYQEPHMMCGILFLISEIIREKADIKMAVHSSLKGHGGEEAADEDLETFEDVEDEDEDDSSADEGDPIDDDDIMIKKEINSIKEDPEDSKQNGLNDKKDIKLLNTHLAAPAASSWYHQSNIVKEKTMRRNYYDPYLRNPQYCGAQFSPLWELLYLQDHYHPSVSMFAETIVKGEFIEYPGDPLRDFTLMKFLDRFVFKNPQKDTEHKRYKSSAVLGSKKDYCVGGTRGLQVTSDAFKKLEGEDIPEDQRFIHGYLTKYKTTKEDDDDDTGSIGDDEFEAHLKKLGGVWAEAVDFDADLDFAAGATGGGKKGVDVDNDSGGEDDSDGEAPEFGGQVDEDDDEMGEDAEFEGDDDDMEFDEENVNFSDDEDLKLPSPGKKGGKFKTQRPQKGSGDKFDAVFASADDFSMMLEDNADEDGGSLGTSKAFANKDKAHTKQLSWERDRDDCTKGQGKYGSYTKRGQKSFRGSRGQNKSRGSSGEPRSERGRGGFKSERGRGGFKSARGRGGFKSGRGRGGGRGGFKGKRGK